VGARAKLKKIPNDTKQIQYKKIDRSKHGIILVQRDIFLARTKKKEICFLNLHKINNPYKETKTFTVFVVCRTEIDLHVVARSAKDSTSVTM